MKNKSLSRFSLILVMTIFLGVSIVSGNNKKMDFPRRVPLRLVLHPLINRWSATVECIVATITTIPLVCVLVYLGSRGRKALVSVSMVALLLSLVNSWIAYKAFLW